VKDPRPTAADDGSGSSEDELLLAPFLATGGRLLVSPSELRGRLQRVRAFLYDWDGVFNSGVKGAGSTSGFSEADAMGTNLLRFGLWMRDDQLPFTGILTGQNNPGAVELARRERFQVIYRGFLDKLRALRHLRDEFGIRPDQVCFLFDDVLDLGAAGECGLRILVCNGAAPLLADRTARGGLCDYTTGREGGCHAVRETAELLLGFGGLYDEVLGERSRHSDRYRRYLSERNRSETIVLTADDV
jgi:3-deoxy-D-manno-octulosonate 8-phosphate phosphatase (KDO 8-P phosphatase)